MHLAHFIFLLLGLLISIALGTDDLSSSHTSDVKGETAQFKNAVERYDATVTKRKENTTATTEYL